MRLQGKVKLGFYPTPAPIVTAIARVLTAQQPHMRMRVLDPCAGDGAALSLLATCLKEQHARQHGRWRDALIETYGIEIQALLVSQAQEVLTQVLHTSFFTTTLSHGDASDGGWQCLYLNPPYDHDVNAASGQKKEREELLFLRRATLLLAPQGILVYIIPQHVLGRAGVARFLSQHYDEMRCLRFPDDAWTPPGSTTAVSLYGQFSQVVLFARRRVKALPFVASDTALQQQHAQIEAWAVMGTQVAALSLEHASIDVPYIIPNAPVGDLRLFLSGSFDPDQAAEAVGHLLPGKSRRPRRGVWASDEYWLARFPPPRSVGLSVGHPLHRFKRGYLIVFAVAGLLNGAVLTGSDGRRILVKGHTRKTIASSTREDEAELVEKETERFESALWCLDLETGDLILVETGSTGRVGWDVARETMSMQTFLTCYGESIMQQMHALNAPRYQSVQQVPWATQAFAHLARKPLGKQLSTILAQVHAYVQRWPQDEGQVPHIAEIAEMASGKTYMAIATAFLADIDACGAGELATSATKRLPFFPAIVLTPPIMAPKWKREIEQTLPHARVLIVERFGAAREEDDEDEDALDERPSRAAVSDARQAFRAFDPDFTGSALGIVGSVDRAVARIRQELACWQRDCDAVVAHNRAVCEGDSTDGLKALPLKPCHVLILTFNTAKMMPQWMPAYRLKPLRCTHRESGKVALLRREDGTPVLVPCCPRCGGPIKDARRLAQEKQQAFAERLDGLRAKRAADGRRIGEGVTICEQRVRAALTSQPNYRTMLGEQEALEQELLDVQERSIEAGQMAQRRSQEQDMKRLELRLEDGERRMQALLARLTSSDGEYAELLEELELRRASLRRQKYRVWPVEIELAESPWLYLSETDLRGTKEHRVKRCCTDCGEPLWQYVAKKPQGWQPFAVSAFLPVLREERSTRSGTLVQYVGTQHATPLPLPGTEARPACVQSTSTRRWAIADYIADHYPDVFHFLIADEVHEGADGTALDQARQVLAAACGRMLGLTGTLSNGYASSLFRLFYVILRQVRQQYPYEGVTQWIRDHGKLQTVQKSKIEPPEVGSGSDSKRKIHPGKPVTREIAGFDPSGMGLVAQCSTFTELKEVVPNLVGYREDIHYVALGEPLGTAYATFEAQATSALGALLAQGDVSGLAPWYTALLTYPDLPWLGWTCKTRHGDLLGTAPALPEALVYPLERALIGYVQQQYEQGLAVLVYTENSGIYDDQERLKYLFETKVQGRGGRAPRVAILRSTSTKKTMDREAWLTRCVEEGVDVLICNPALVKVGLDLLHFKRIVYKRVPRKVTDLRQSSRRSLRPGQDSDIEVVFFAYEESMALRLLRLMARKTYASLVVEGKLPSEGLVSLSFEEEEEEGDIMNRMAREMLDALKDGTLGQSPRLAEELQELTRRSIEIERTQGQDAGDEDIEARVVLEQIRTVPVHVSANFFSDELPTVADEEEPATPTIVVDASPTAPDTTEPPTILPAVVDAATPVQGVTDAQTPAPTIVDASPTAPGVSKTRKPRAVAPPVEPEPLQVTIVPVSITEDPWAGAVAVQASQDVWALLRQQLGPRRRGRRT